MEDKKDVQQKIVETNPTNEKATEEDLHSVLRSIAPGTHIRTGLNGILKAGKGALIVVDNEFLPNLVDGGFRLNARFTPQRLIELSKMDGAILLSRDMKRIITANALLTPDSRTQSNETGTRHKAAERVARQAATLAVAISERKNEITLFYKNLRYPIADSGELLRRANENIQILEKQRDLFDKAIQKLNFLELRNYKSFDTAIYVIQKAGIINKIANNMKGSIIELGKDSALIKARLRELTADIDREAELIVKDYAKINYKTSKWVIDEMGYENLVSKEDIAKALGHEKTITEEKLKGWRILSKTSLSEPEIAAIIKEAQTLGTAIHSKRDFYETIIGQEKAAAFKNEIEDIKLNI